MLPLEEGRSATARALLAWVAERLEPSGRIWVDAMIAELGVIEGRRAQVVWAAGGLRLFWTHRRRGEGSTLRFWLWAGWHGAMLGFILLTTALADGYIVPMTLGYCAAAGLLTALWTRRPAIAGTIGATTALTAIGVLIMTIGVTHRGSANWPPFGVVLGLVLAIPMFAALGLVAGLIGSAIISPGPVAAAVWGAVTDGPAWRVGQLLQRTLRPH